MSLPAKGYQQDNVICQVIGDETRSGMGGDGVPSANVPTRCFGDEMSSSNLTGGLKHGFHNAVMKVRAAMTPVPTVSQFKDNRARN